MQNATPSALVTAARKLDAITWFAIACLLIGWFVIDTLHVSFGPLQHGVAFYDFAAIIGQPVRLFTGIDHSHAFGTFLFALICGFALLCPLAPYLRSGRDAWLAYLAPLILIVACGVLLYARTSGEVIATSNEPAAISNDIIRFASDLIHRGGSVAARKVSIAPGGYLAAIGSVLLALRGLQRFHSTSDKRTTNA